MIRQEAIAKLFRKIPGLCDRKFSWQGTDRVLSLFGGIIQIVVIGELSQWVFRVDEQRITQS